MATKIRFSTEIKTVPYYIHTGISSSSSEDIKRFIKGDEYKRYVTDSFMDRKKMEVTSTDITEVSTNKFKAVLNINGIEQPVEALIECFVFNK